MSFLDTEPAAIHRIDAAGPWGGLRINDPRRRLALLREICRLDVPLTVGDGAGATAPVLLWTIDEPTGRLGFSLTPSPALPALPALLAAASPWAAGYLHGAKVQFDVRGLTRDDSGPQPMLRAHAPRYLLHMPRRDSVRVRRPDADAPVVCLRAPGSGGPVLRLPVLDISLTGCALWLPAGSAGLGEGTHVHEAEVELDPDALFHAGLVVQHVTLSASVRLGLRLGCAWAGMPPASAETLERWIARGHRRRDRVSLAFD